MSRSKSVFICKRCGLPVIGWLNGWKHASGGKLGKARRPHKPVPVARPSNDSADIMAMLKRRQDWT